MSLSHPENVPGDFYIEDGCCTSCAVIFDIAPGLFAWSKLDDGHCYVCKQPSTSGEVDAMLLSIEAADLRCIRYKGRDRAIQVRLVRMNESGQCDDLLPEFKKPPTGTDQT